MLTAILLLLLALNEASAFRPSPPPRRPPALSGLDLSGLDLSGLDLSGLDLSTALPPDLPVTAAALRFVPLVGVPSVVRRIPLHCQVVLFLELDGGSRQAVVDFLPLSVSPETSRKVASLQEVRRPWRAPRNFLLSPSLWRAPRNFLLSPSLCSQVPGLYRLKEVSADKLPSLDARPVREGLRLGDLITWVELRSASHPNLSLVRNQCWTFGWALLQFLHYGHD
jgi:hypothetical protein